MTGTTETPPNFHQRQTGSISLTASPGLSSGGPSFAHSVTAVGLSEIIKCMRRKRRRYGNCAYCGIGPVSLTRDHVIPRGLIPASSRSSNQLIVVDVCEACNHSFSDDEAHFRTVVALAGESNDAVRELWDSQIMPGLYEKDGCRRAWQIVEQTTRTEIDGISRMMIYPSRDERVIRVLKKIIRGLLHYHEIESAVREERILLRLLEHPPSGELFWQTADLMGKLERVCLYWCRIGRTSEWVLTFFDRLSFVALVVDPSQEGNPEHFGPFL